MLSINIQYNTLTKSFTQQLFLFVFFPLVIQSKEVNVVSALYCRSYGFISTSTKEQLLICFANQVNQTSANRLAVADVELICFVEFPCQVIAWQIVIEQVAEC